MEHSIAGRPIPPGLIAVIQAGKWNPPTDPQVYIDVFGELPDHPMFYGLDQMACENRFPMTSSLCCLLRSNGQALRSTCAHKAAGPAG